MKTKMTWLANYLVVAAIAMVPSMASAAIDLDDPGDEPSTPPPSGGGGGGGDPTTPQPTWQKTVSNSQCFPACASSWGAGFSISGRLAATPKSTPGTRDKLEGSAGMDAFAKINGGRYSLFGVKVAGVTEAKVRTDLSLTAYVGGAAVYTKPFLAIAGTYTPLAASATWPTTFLDKSVTVGVGPIPVTFRVRATGQLAANLTGRISNVGFEASAGPSGKASLYASGAVGASYCAWGACVGATAGLEVNVTLVEIAAPVSWAVWWSLVNQGFGVNLNFGLNAALTMKSLDGWLGVFAEACLGGCLRWDSQLIDWDGIAASYGLLNINGKYCLTGDCGSVGGML